MLPSIRLTPLPLALTFVTPLVDAPALAALATRPAMRTAAFDVQRVQSLRSA